MHYIHNLAFNYYIHCTHHVYNPALSCMAVIVCFSDNGNSLSWRILMTSPRQMSTHTHITWREHYF